MNPAYSVIFFTTASGAGYGLLAWLVALAFLGDAPPPGEIPWSWLAAHLVAFVLVSAGLLASTAHLGHPERAWRAFSQWRTSWLSREGVLAVLTFLPWLLHVAAGAGFGASGRGLTLAAGAVAAGGALATVWCTGMIYQSLPTIRAWHQPLVAPLYVLLSLATGGVLALAGLAWSGEVSPVAAGFAIVLVALSGALKTRYWRQVDAAERSYTAGAATGLGRYGTVRVLDPPHTQANFVMREMGFVVARKHARRLRRVATLLLFVAPLACLAALVGSMAVASMPAASGGPGLLPAASAALALLATTCGVVVERWLFFAEAQHVVTLFYGADRA